MLRLMLPRHSEARPARRPDRVGTEHLRGLELAMDLLGMRTSEHHPMTFGRTESRCSFSIESSASCC